MASVCQDGRGKKRDLFRLHGMTRIMSGPDRMKAARGSCKCRSVSEHLISNRCFSQMPAVRPRRCAPSVPMAEKRYSLSRRSDRGDPLP